MVGDVQDIYCSKCGKYLFTEKDTTSGMKRENDYVNYIYDEVKDIFMCNECSVSSGRIIWNYQNIFKIK